MGYNNPMEKEETRNQHIDPEPAGSLGAQPAEQPQQPAYGMAASGASPEEGAATGMVPPASPAAEGGATPSPGDGPAPATMTAPAAEAPDVPLADVQAPAPSEAAPVSGPMQAQAEATPLPASPWEPEEGEPAADAQPAAPAPDQAADGPAAQEGPAGADATDGIAESDEPEAAEEPEEPEAPDALEDLGEPQATDAQADLADLDDLDDLDALDDLDDLDALDERYVWDAVRQRLYEKKPPKARKPRSLFYWLAWGGCALLLVLSVVGWFRNGRLLLPVAQAAPAQSESQAEAQEAAPQPAPASEATQTQGEAEEAYVPTIILVEGSPIGTLASQEAAYSLLEDVKNYYAALAQENSPGELTVEVLEEVTFASAAPDALTDGYESLYQQLTQEEDSPLTIRCTVVAKTAQTLPYETREEKDKYLLEGTRIVEQMGREGASLTMTYTVYDNGRKRTSLSDTEEETIQPQDRVVRIGTQKVDPDAKPDEDTGRKGPDTQLTFQPPAEGKILRHFGQLQGAMHLGVDYGVGEEGQLTVAASCGGQVVSVLQRGGYGLVVEIDHGDGFLTRYAKLTSAQVALGDTVAAGQAIGLIQQADGEEEAYLHFELRAGGEAYNPCFYFD